MIRRLQACLLFTLPAEVAERGCDRAIVALIKRLEDSEPC